MQTPPPYYAAGPKKSNTGIIIAIVVGILVLCCGGVFALYFAGVNFVKGAAGFVTCGWSLGQDRDALVAYAKAHHDTLPDKATWEDDIKPYLKPLPDSGPIDIAPPGSGVCDVKANSGISFNADLAGKKLSSIKDPYTTILVWEVPSVSRNQSTTYSEPAPGSGPAIVGSQKRGWVLQPIEGSGYFVDERGNKSPIPTPGATSVNFQDNNGNVKVNAGDENGKSDPNSTHGKIEVHTTGG